MNTQKYILTGTLMLVFSFGFSQKGKIRRASTEYDKFAYVKTTEILLDVANNGYQSSELYKKLGNAYYFNNKMEDAAKWYGELIKMNEPIDPELFFRYAQALKTVGKYDESDQWMEKFRTERSDDLRGKAFVTNVDYLSKIDEVSRDDVQIRNLDINSEVSDFGTTQYKNQLVFASSRGQGRSYKWNEQAFLDLYYAEKQDDQTYANVTKFNDALNTKFHESSAAFTPDNQFMFFTRNNYYKRKYKEDKAGTNRLKMYRATLQSDGDWDNIVPVHFNNDDYSVAHPSINVQGTKMYFASDMIGTTGLSDLYVVDINQDGTLETPVNLGAKINTEGQESFPYINSRGDLYFSSNSYSGLGGLDVYVIKNFENEYKNRSTNYIVENVGRPINSPKDDFGYYENLETKEGFFTSNRDGGKGDDDIYTFVVSECEQIVTGVVKDTKTGALLPESTVTLYDESGNLLESLVVGVDTTFSFNLDCKKEYLVRGNKTTYIGDEQRITTPSTKQELTIELLLDKDEQELRPCDDLAKVLDIPIIYFSFDKYDIRYDAEVELQKVLAVLKKYPTMHIDIRSHTDCRGTYAYNETLSSNRAKSTRQYLINKGIEAERLTAKGYGESQLVNDCGCEPTNESDCSETEHQKNRRSEFIISSFKGEKCSED